MADETTAAKVTESKSADQQYMDAATQFGYREWRQLACAALLANVTPNVKAALTSLSAYAMLGDKEKGRWDLQDESVMLLTELSPADWEGIWAAALNEKINKEILDHVITCHALCIAAEFESDDQVTSPSED